MQNKKQLMGLIFGLLVGILVYLFPLNGISWEAHAQLALTLMTVIFWAFNVAPSGYVSGLYCAALILLKVAPAQTVFSVWLTPTLWLLIASFLIAGAVGASGLGGRIAYGFTSKFVHDYRSLVISIAVLQVALGLIIPNVFARSFLILSIVKEICSASSFNKYDSILFGLAVFLFATPSGMVFLTSESSLNMMCLNFAGIDISWTAWFIQIGIPCLICLAFFVIIFMLFFKPTGEIQIDRSQFKNKLEALGPMSSKEKRMLVWLIIFVLFWCTSSITKINLAYGTLGLAVLMGFPFIGGLITPKTFSEVPVNMLMFLTGAITIGSVGAATGMNQWIALTIMPTSFPNNTLLILLFITTITIAIHMLLGSVVAVMAVAIPTMVAFTSANGLNVSPAIVALLSYFVLTNQFLLTFHNLPLAAGSDAGGYSDKDVLRFGIPATVLIYVMTIGIIMPWWKLLGLL